MPKTPAAAEIKGTNLVEVTVPMPAPGASEAAKTFLANAESLVIASADDYAAAGETLKVLAKRESDVEALRKSLKKPIDEAAARIQELFKTPLNTFERAKAIIKRKMGSYYQEQERLRKEAQQKANEAARKEQDRLAAQARKAEAAGKVGKAVELEARAASVVAPILSTAAPKLTGVQMREVWCFEVVDPSLVPPEYKVVDETKIRGVVNALKGGTNIAGVRVWPENRPAAGARS